MRTRLVLVILLVWFLAIVVAFTHYQFRGFEQANPFGDYVLSALAVLVAVVVATALGLRVLAPERPRPRDAVLGLAVGLAILAIAALALAAAKMLRPYVIWPAMVAAGALSYRQVVTLASLIRAFRLRQLTAVEGVLIGLLSLAGLIVLANCLAPLTANDALVYHLNLPKIYARASGLVQMPHLVYANMPHYGEMLYALFYVLAGETGAKLAYLVLMAGAALAVYVLARRFAPRSLALGVAAIFLVEPLVLDSRIVCNVDVLLTYCYIVAITLVLESLDGKPALKQAVAIGLVTGLMLGVKYTAIAPVLSLVALPLVASRKRPSPTPFLVAALIAVAVFAPWLVKNQIYVGNPLYPLFEQTLGGAHWDTVQETQLMRWQHSMGMGRDLLKYLALPFNVSTRAKPGMYYMFFDGTMTPLVLILLPLVFVRRSRPVLTLTAMAALVFLFWSATSQQLRFLMPAIALGAVLGAAGLAYLTGGAAWRSVLVLGLAAAVMGGLLLVPDQNGSPFVAGTLAGRLPVVLGLESKQEYLGRSIQSFGMFDQIKKTLPPGAPVFLIWENRAYYLDNPYFADSFFEASSVMRLVALSRDPDDLAHAIGAMGYKYIVVNDRLGEFFSRYYPPAEIAKLKDFMAQHLDTVATSNKITLYAMRP